MDTIKTTFDADGLAVEAVPLGGTVTGPIRDDLAKVVLPPAELVDELDNSGAAGPEPAPGLDPGDEAVTLDFVGEDLPARAFPLKYPFRWEGERHDAVTVRQLTTAEVARISGEWGRSGKPPEYFDIYAVMTGLPAKVLRALPHADGGPIVDAAYDFLPPSFRGEAG